jgi:hydroxyacylglutathione hydrolase
MISTRSYKTWKTRNGYTITRVISGRSNVYLFSNGVMNFLVDTSVVRLWKKLERRLEFLDVRHIDYLILTHSHYDHTANARKIRDKYKTKIIAHKHEESCLATGEMEIPMGTTLITRFLVKLLAKRLAPLFRFETSACDLPMDETFDLQQFGINTYIMHTPGHTSGSVSVIVDNEVAIVGDAMFGVFRGSVFPPYADDVEQMVKSWGKLLETGCGVFLPSHGSANSRKLVERNYHRRIRNFVKSDMTLSSDESN